MKEPIIEINNFTGGQTLSDKMGSKNQFHIGNQLDFFSRSGYLTTGNAFTNIPYAAAEALPAEFNCMIYASKDGFKYFGGDDGKIYVEKTATGAGTVTTNGTTTLTGDGTTFTTNFKAGDPINVEGETVRVVASITSDTVLLSTAAFTTSEATLDYYLTNGTSGTLEVARTIAGASIKGLAEYKGYLYYATDIALGRWDFAASWTDSWQTLNTATWHQIIIQAAKLYVGNGQYISLYDGTTWTAQGLDLDTGWVARCLTPFGLNYIAIGANFGSVKCDVLLWDRTAVSWGDTIKVPENSIQALIFDAGYIWIWAGSSCNIYVCSEGSRQAIKMWSFTRENPLNDFNVYPMAVLAKKGTIYFGLSDVDSASDDRNPAAIYSFPIEPQKFSLNIPIKKTGHDERYKSISSMGTNNTLYAGFRDYISGGAEYNNLKREKTIDETSPYSDTAEYESFYFKAPANGKIITEQIGITMDTLLAGCNITLSYKKDAETSYTPIFSDFSTANAIEKKVEQIIEARRIKFKLQLRGSTTTTNRPYIDSIYATGKAIPRI